MNGKIEPVKITGFIFLRAYIQDFRKRGAWYFFFTWPVVLAFHAAFKSKTNPDPFFVPTLLCLPFIYNSGVAVYRQFAARLLIKVR